MKRVLITGVCGFIGSHLAERLVNEGNEVVGIDDMSTGQNIPSDIELFNVDITKVNWDSFDLEQFDEVYHLAAMVGVKRILAEPIKTLDVNIFGTHRLLEAVIKLEKKPKLFVASTSEVYGKNEKRKLSENDDRIIGSTLKSRWIYAESKAIDEFLTLYHSQANGLTAIIARFFNITGPRQVSQYGMVLPKFVEQATKNEPITVYGDGTQIRSFMHVEDCVDCILKLMNNPDIKESKIINIGNYDPVMIKDLAFRIKVLTASTSSIQIIPYEEGYNDKGFEDMMYRVPDITYLESLIGKTNFKTLDQIIHDVANFRSEF